MFGIIRCSIQDGLATRTYKTNHNPVHYFVYPYFPSCKATKISMTIPVDICSGLVTFAAMKFQMSSDYEIQIHKDGKQQISRTSKTISRRKKRLITNNSNPHANHTQADPHT